MKLTLTPEQLMLKDTARKFLEAEYSFESRTKRAQPAQLELGLWRSFGEMGWLGIGLGEEWGGFGGLFEQILIQEELARVLAVEPYLEVMVIAAWLIEQSGTDDVKTDILPSLVAGEKLAALAWMETSSRYDPLQASTRAVSGSGGLQITGSKVLVAGGAAIDWYLVSARGLDGELGLYVVDSRADGVRRRQYRAFDGSYYCDVEFVDAVGLNLLGTGIVADKLLEVAFDRACVALCAGLVGNMAVAVETTTAYSKMRRQFGSALSDFQVVQHHLVDMLIDTEQSRSAVLGGLAALTRDAEGRRFGAAACMVEVLGHCQRVTGQAIHQHGGIGVTRELAIGHHYRRALIAGKLLGDMDFHLGRMLPEAVR